jgi:hypothetical protein
MDTYTGFDFIMPESLTGQQFHQYHQQNEQSPLTEHKKRKENNVM